VDASSRSLPRFSLELGAAAARCERPEVMDGTPLESCRHLSIDGTGVPMRREVVAGGAGKQEDGTAKTREAKLAVVFTAEGRDPETGAAARDRGRESFRGLIDSAAAPSGRSPSCAPWGIPLKTPPSRRAGRRGFGSAPFRERHEAVEACCRCFVSTLGRMRSGEERQRGIPVGSGVVEGGCRPFGRRRKRSRTRGSARGANAMLALKSCAMTLRLRDFLDWRANQAMAA